MKQNIAVFITARRLSANLQQIKPHNSVLCDYYGENKTAGYFSINSTACTGNGVD
jgi:hypothetical protein